MILFYFRPLILCRDVLLKMCSFVSKMFSDLDPITFALAITQVLKKSVKRYWLAVVLVVKNYDRCGRKTLRPRCFIHSKCTGEWPGKCKEMDHRTCFLIVGEIFSDKHNVEVAAIGICHYKTI